MEQAQGGREQEPDRALEEEEEDRDAGEEVLQVRAETVYAHPAVKDHSTVWACRAFSRNVRNAEQQ